MESIFDLISAIHPDVGLRLFKVEGSNEMNVEDVEEFAYFPPRRFCVEEWTSAFIEFQNDYKDVPATVRVINISPHEAATLDVFVVFGSDTLNRAKLVL